MWLDLSSMAKSDCFYGQMKSQAWSWPWWPCQNLCPCQKLWQIQTDNWALNQLSYRICHDMRPLGHCFHFHLDKKPLKRNGTKKCAYGVCPNKWQGDDKKVRQKYQNLGHLQTAISQARNKLLTNFQRLESTTIHGHMRCVKISNKRRVKKCQNHSKFNFVYLWLPEND